MRIYNFSRNWNNKLDCDCFSTIRLRNDSANVIHDIVLARLNTKKDKRDYKCEVTYIHHFLLDNLTTAMANLDMALPKDKAKGVLFNMYKSRVPDFSKQQLSFIVLKKIK